MNKVSNIDYIIPIKGLSIGKHDYSFTIENNFFEEYENREISGAQLEVLLTLDKHDTFIDIKGNFKGTVTTECDRCLGEVDIEMNFMASLLVKFAKTAIEGDTEEILTLDPSESELDLKQFFYDYIYLALPIQRVHKEEECDPVMLEKLKNYIVISDQEKKESPFDKLKSLKN